MKKLPVNLGQRSYPIFIGDNLLQDGININNFVKGSQVLIVTNQTIAPLYLDKTLSLFADFLVDAIVLPDGEQFKDFATLNQILDTLLSKKFDRNCTLVALGGGVIGDITGFAAAVYQRGVNFIQIPTTLLAQVDSSVGGKTGINHPLGKNMIGAFYQPKCVIADLSTLKTLEPRQISAGLAEIIKYGLINDAQFFVWLEQNIAKLLGLDKEAITYAVFKSCENKADIVAKDEKEAGIRATLNLGHTFGHAIEASQGYGVWLHGEAVAAGMVMAADLSNRMGLIESEAVKRIKQIIRAANLPTKGPAAMSEQEYLKYMKVDKKVSDGKIKLVLLNGIGSSLITDDFEMTKLKETLFNCTEGHKGTLPFNEKK